MVIYFVQQKVIQLAVLIIVLSGSASCWADDNVSCVKVHLEKRKQSLGIASNDVEELTSHIARAIGISSNITAVPCRLASKASSWVPRASDGVPNAQYILYDPVWTREVTGDNRAKVVALFGHELGHFFNGHFTYGAAIDPRKKEEEADRFAGCAVARLIRDFTKLKELLIQLREEAASASYPNRLNSIRSAQAGFDSCSDVPSESEKAIFRVQAGQSPSFDLLHTNTKLTMTERLAKNETLQKYLRVEWLPYGSVAAGADVLAAVQQGTLSATMFRSNSRPAVTGLVPISCGEANWLIVNSSRWAELKDAAAAALVRVCSGPL